MEYLVAHEIPFRLIYNVTQKRKTPQPARSSRHAENQVADLVFVTVQTKQRAVNLHDAYRNCLFRDPVAASSTLTKHFVHVIISQKNQLFQDYLLAASSSIVTAVLGCLCIGRPSVDLRKHIFTIMNEVARYSLREIPSGV